MIELLKPEKLNAIEADIKRRCGGYPPVGFVADVNGKDALELIRGYREHLLLKAALANPERDLGGRAAR